MSTDTNGMKKLYINAETEMHALQMAQFTGFKMVELDPDTLQLRWILTSVRHQIIEVGRRHEVIYDPNAGPAWLHGWWAILYVIDELYPTVLGLFQKYGQAGGVEVVEDFGVDIL